MKSDLITDSRMRAFRACPKLHFYEYELGYRPAASREAPAFGSMMHVGLEAWWLAHKDGRPDEALAAALTAIAAKATKDGADVFTVVRARVLMTGYDLRWAASMADYEVVAVEVEFATEMQGPNGGKCRGVRLAGKIDAIVRRISDGTIWLVEHKTSGADLRPGSTYWTRLRMDSQISVYFDGAASLGHDVAGCLYDVIDKPDQRPLKATPAADRKYTKGDGRLYKNQRETDETEDEYAQRLADAIGEAPERFYQRQEVVRLETELTEARLDTYATMTMLRDSIRTGRAPRNVDACTRYGSACEFLSICSGMASLDDPTQFRKLETMHPELATGKTPAAE